MRYLYVESSAIVRALLEGDEDLKRQLDGTGMQVTSTITRLEAARALTRKADQDPGAEGFDQARSGIALLARTATLIPVTEEILAAAAARFPVEPVRTLDAIHLASVTLWQREVGRTAIASVDKRVRANALALGLEVLP